MEEGLENCAHQGRRLLKIELDTMYGERSRAKHRTHGKNNTRGNIESMLIPFSWGN